MKRHWPLRTQLLAGVSTLVAVVALAFALLAWHEHRSFERVRDEGKAVVDGILREALQRRGVEMARALADRVANPLYFIDIDGIDEAASAVESQSDVSEVLVADARGRLLHGSVAGGAGFGDALAAFAGAEAGEAGTLWAWRGDTLVVEAPVVIGGRAVGRVRLDLRSTDAARIAGDWNTRIDGGLQSTRQAHLVALLGAMGVVLLVGALAFAALRRNVLKPIARMVRAAGAIRSGRFGEARALEPRDDEIGELTRVFASMADAVARHQREVRRIAYTDPLTGLGNRLALGESLESRLLTLQASSGELALMFIDLDDTKRINDTLGHHVGDELLVEVATRLRAACAAEPLDSVELARFGGDEFVLLFAAADVRQRAESLARRILDEVRKPLPMRQREVVVTASIGITVFPDDAASAQQMVKNADMAMYQAKAAGKGCFRFYSRALDEAAERRGRLEHDLRGAWERGEMRLAFQPVFDLTDGRPVGAEALLRWNHPELGLVPPSIFIGIAEESGQVDVIGQRVLAEAVRIASGWSAAPGVRAPFVAVNVSPRQLLRGDLPETVEAALLAGGLDPHRLHLELTETAILSDEAQATAAFTRLRARGIGVWLDDFGTGFSGLSHLRRVPVDGVKIDRSFVTDLLRDPNDLALTTGVIAMAHSLGVTVVAEGIENEGQHAVLRERGCPLGQGFHLAAPMDAEAIAALFT